MVKRRQAAQALLGMHLDRTAEREPRSGAVQLAGLVPMTPGLEQAQRVAGAVMREFVGAAIAASSWQFVNFRVD